MKFIDQANIRVAAGAGGDGILSFHREKHVPLGGPDGGNGGAGGNIILQCDVGKSTLMDVRTLPLVQAKSGQKGGSSHCRGKGGEDTIIKIPPGTEVYDQDTGEFLGDLLESSDQLLVARGGRGGLGNAAFVNSRDRAPRKITLGQEGEEKNIQLELKLLADVGLVGRPNAGKSTFLSVISKAKPKIADYPFTTLVPQLGVVQAGNYQSFTVADIPGLIEGASAGHGMGLEFLRHIERTRVFLHLIDVSDPSMEDAWHSYVSIRNELLEYKEHFSNRPEWIVLTKADLNLDLVDSVKSLFEEKGLKVYVLSSVSRIGLDTILRDLAAEVLGNS